jgi:membrane associated rhomboid family serine protease/DNA-directed RNA polymerase subunit RPC12/RpoP
MAGTPDLFVVCKNCGNEVSPYITECPYCGHRLRKRAPKIERDQEGQSRPKLRRVAKPTLGPLRAGEIPGIRGDETRRPYVTIVLVALGAIGLLVLTLASKVDLVVFGKIPNGEWWRVVTSPFMYLNVWYQFAALLAIGVYGWLLERRHGPVVVAVLFALSGVGGIAAAAALESYPIAFGGNGAALGFIAAWAVPVLLARRHADADDDDADLLGTAILFALVALMPIATPDADVVAGGVGAAAGALLGLALARLSPR